MKSDKADIMFNPAMVAGGESVPGKRVWRGKWIALPALLAAGLFSPAAWADCPSPHEVGKQFPGPPVRDDLRQTLTTSKDCMNTIQPKRMTPRELQELRKAIRDHATANGRKLRSR